MKLRSRQDPIGAFWSWWAGASSALAGSGAGGVDAEELTERVRAIDAGLEWEIGPGDGSELLLCVTAAGQMRLRATAERWRLAAPAPDATWSYASARPPAPAKFDLALRYGSVELDPSDVRFGATAAPERHEIDVVVHHPRFAELDEVTAQSIAFLLLDWLLGEDDVERWIGQIEVASEAPEPLPLGEQLVAQVAALRAGHAEPRFAVLKATRKGRASRVIIRKPLKRVEYPLFDLHGCLEVAYGKADDNDGMPEGPAKEALDELTAELEERGGDDVLFAVRMTGEGTRTYDVFVDSQGVGRQRIEEVLREPRWRRTKTSWNLDPEWTVLDRYRYS